MGSGKTASLPEASWDRCVGLLNGELANPYPQPLGQVKGCPPTLEGDDLSWRHVEEDFGIEQGGNLALFLSPPACKTHISEPWCLRVSTPTVKQKENPDQKAS